MVEKINLEPPAVIRNRPKIQDVARVAGVSTATVSRTLSKPEAVSKATRDMVLEAVQATGYRADHAARNLRRRRSGAIVVLVPNLGNPFFSQILAAIENTMSAAGYSVLIADTMQPQFRKQQILEHLHNNSADGMIVLDGSMAEEFLRSETAGIAASPVVFACEWTDKLRYPSVRIDNHSGAAMAVRHLIDLGHCKIGHIAGPAHNVLTTARREGFKAELKASGLKIRSEWDFDGDFSIEAGIQAAQSWFDLDNRPTAMFCASDEIAFGFISELNSRGIRVPDDVSVVGFDDIDIARHFIPPLTTIHQPRNDMGEMAARKLLANILGVASADQQDKLLLPVELIVRKSTAAPK